MGSLSFNEWLLCLGLVVALGTFALSLAPTSKNKS
jgi:hypothetical protein